MKDGCGPCDVSQFVFGLRVSLLGVAVLVFRSRKLPYLDERLKLAANASKCD